MKASEQIAPGEAPAPTGPAPGGLTEVAKAIVPGIGAAMKAIEVAVKAWDLIKPDSGKTSFGPRGDFAAGIHNTTKEQVERATRYALATAFIEVIMRLGADAGIDFKTWRGGLPPDPNAHPASGAGQPAPAAGAAAPAPAPSAPAAAPSAAAPAPSAAAPAPAPAAPAPTHGTAPAAPAAPAAPDLTRFQPLLAFLADSSLAEVKSIAKIALENKIVRNANLALPKWYWNGSDQKGFGEPPQVGQFTKVEKPGFWSLGPPLPYDKDADGRTYFQMFTWSISVAKLAESVMLGLPPEMMHFSSIPFGFGPAMNIGWFEAGGSFVSGVHEAHGDTLTIQGGTNIFTPAINPPIGGHLLKFEFMWDRGPTSVDFELSFEPLTMQPTVKANPEGVPKT
jgi:hypothetical protein